MPSQCKPAGKSGAAAWPDRLGIWASAACVVHCVVTPVLLSLSSVLAHLLPSEERVHRSLAVALAVVGAMALLQGFRKHRRRRVCALMATGLGCIFFGAFYGRLLPSHWLELSVTLLGSAQLIAAHWLNHTFCRECPCVDE